MPKRKGHAPKNLLTPDGKSKTEKDRRKERELRKIEDCWTKNLDLHEDVLCTRSRAKQTPTPNKSKAKDNRNSKETKKCEIENNATFEGSKIPRLSSCQRNLFNQERTINESSDNVKTENLGEQRQTTITAVSENDSHVTVTSSAEDDESPTKSMPHLKQFLQPQRKRLRSEVKHTELWDGFPVDIRMPRLKPRLSEESRRKDTPAKEEIDSDEHTNSSEEAKPMVEKEMNSEEQEINSEEAQSPVEIEINSKKEQFNSENVKPPVETKIDAAEQKNNSEQVENLEQTEINSEEIKSSVLTGANSVDQETNTEQVQNAVVTIIDSREQNKYSEQQKPKEETEVDYVDEHQNSYEAGLESHSEVNAEVNEKTVVDSVEKKTDSENVKTSVGTDMDFEEENDNSEQVKTPVETEIYTKVTENCSEDVYVQTWVETELYSEEQRHSSQQLVHVSETMGPILDTTFYSPEYDACVNIPFLEILDDGMTITQYTDIKKPKSSASTEEGCDFSVSVIPKKSKSVTVSLQIESEAEIKALPLDTKNHLGMKPLKSQKEIMPKENGSPSENETSNIKSEISVNRSEINCLKTEEISQECAINYEETKQEKTIHNEDPNATSLNKQTSPRLRNMTDDETLCNKNPDELSDQNKKNKTIKQSKKSTERRLLVKLKFKKTRNTRKGIKVAEIIPNDEGTKRDAKKEVAVGGGASEKKTRSPARATRLHSPIKSDSSILMLTTSREPRGAVLKEVKLSAELLKDHRLSNAACLLWSSENRRRLQQEGLMQDSGSLEAVMRREWALLSDQEKLPYLKRARSAVEYKSNKDKETNVQKSNSYTNYSAEKFSVLSSTLQDKWLSNKLKSLQVRLENDGYKQFLLRFQREHEKLKKAATGQSIPVSDKEFEQRLARQLLFHSVTEAERKLGELLSERDAVRHHHIITHFNDTVKKLASPVAAICKSALPEELSEQTTLLEDIMEAIDSVEKRDALVESKPSKPSCKDYTSSPRYRRALRFLKYGVTLDMFTMRIDNEDWLVPSCTNRVQYRNTLQNAVSAKQLRCLTWEDVCF